MKISQALLLILTSVAITIAVGFFLFAPKGTTFTSAPTHKETVYERVMRTGTIRCGYGLWGEYLNKDPNTGKMGGIFYDYMEELGKGLGLKIEWTEETGWAEYISGLNANRFDAFCTLVALNAQRARQADFVGPIFYMASDIFVRDGDVRFDGNPAKLNSPDITMLTYEGDIYEKISNREFPKAKKMQLPSMSTEAELFLSVATGKADATITETSVGLDFIKKNPGKLRIVKLNGPFRFIPVTISIKGGEYQLQRMLDIATMELTNMGVIDSILKRHGKYPDTLLRIAKPYEVVR